MRISRRLIAAGAGIAAVAVIGTATLTIASEYRQGGETGSELPAGLAFEPDVNSRHYGTDAQIELLQERLRNDPEDFEASIALAGQYLQKVRETGDPSLYAQAEQVLQAASRTGEANPDYWAARAQLDLARHEFAEALTWATRAVAADPGRAKFYGLLADAQVELGQYDAAVASLQKMVDLRPDFASFSRIAYVRELHGDPEGAALAMESAIEAGSGVPENLAWAQTELGRLRFALNDWRGAAGAFEMAMAIVPDYPAALAGQARLAAAEGDLDGARERFALALERMPVAEYAIGLGDVLAAMGDAEGAQRQYDLVAAMDRLQSQNGVNTDLEAALFLADRGIEPAEAVERARLAYAERPNIYAADVLAWALYQSGQAEEAQEYAAEALRLGTRNSLLLFHAGMIAEANGDTEAAEEYLFDALRFNPGFSIVHAAQARATLEELGSDLPAASS